MSRNVHEGTVAAITPLARGVVEWRLLMPEPLSFVPGQFISLRVGDDSDGNAILRSYSIASSPGQREIAIILKLVEGGVGSAWFSRLVVGERVRFTGPMGFFVLELGHPGDVVFAATGVGITPVLPMLEAELARAETGRVYLLWGNRDEADLFWSDELGRLAAHPRLTVRRFLSGASPPGDREAGRIVAPLLALVPTLVHPTFYLVGNGAMIKDAKAGLVAAGMDRRRQIRVEAFFDS